MEFTQKTATPPPPPLPQLAPLLAQPLHPESINLHFGAIDPVQFDSAKIFDQSQMTGTFFHQSSNNSEMGLNSAQPFSISTGAKMPAASSPPPPPPLSQSESIPMANETLSHLPMMLQQQHHHHHHHLQQTNPIGHYQFPVIAETANDSVKFQQQNQELNDLLQVERMRTHELSVKVTQQHSTIEGLTTELNELRKCANTIAAMQQQISAHTQTVNILVGEKSDLMAKVQQRDQRLADYESESVELQGRLKASRHRVAELEKDLNTLAQSHQKYDGSQQVLCTELETLQEENKHLKRLHQESCDENTEFQHQLAQKLKEIDELKVIVGAKNKELEMAHVRLEQLTGGDPMQPASASTTNAEHTQPDGQQRLLDAERQVIELQNMISDMTSDRDRTQQQYQTYVQHLTSETATQTQRIQELAKANEKLTKREQSLINHVQELEKQIQKQISTQRRLAALRDEEKPNTGSDASPSSGSDMMALQEKLQAIDKEKSDLNVSVSDFENEIVAKISAHQVTL